MNLFDEETVIRPDLKERRRRRVRVEWKNKVPKTSELRCVDIFEQSVQSAILGE